MSPELKFAIKLAKEAGNYALARMDKVKIIAAKDKIRSIYTNIDIEVEKLVLKKIGQKYPSYNIISEETGEKNNKSDYSWIVDPIDGTRFFENGVKYFSVSIALWYKARPLLGVVYNPGNKELYWAEKGQGAYCNSRKLKVSKTSELKKSIICFVTGGLSRLKGKKQKILFGRLEKIIQKMYRFRTAPGCLAPCYVARGLFDAYFDLTGNENIWDPAAGIIIAQEAGAKVTNLEDKFPGLNTSHLVITNGKIHDKVLKLLK